MQPNQPAPESGNTSRSHEDKDFTIDPADVEAGWKHCVKTMSEFDEKLVRGWREELNNLLIFVRRPVS